jgi:hypothetical protein
LIDDCDGLLHVISVVWVLWHVDHKPAGKHLCVAHQLPAANCCISQQGHHHHLPCPSFTAAAAGTKEAAVAMLVAAVRPAAGYELQ